MFTDKSVLLSYTVAIHRNIDFSFQRERSLHNYMPRSVVVMNNYTCVHFLHCSILQLISSAVPKAEELLSAVKPDVLGLIYVSFNSQCCEIQYTDSHNYRTILLRPMNHF